MNQDNKNRITEALAIIIFHLLFRLFLLFLRISRKDRKVDIMQEFMDFVNGLISLGGGCEMIQPPSNHENLN